MAAALLALLLAPACSPLITLNAVLVPDDGWQAEQAIAYGPVERQRLDIYRPEPIATAPAPVVVFFYGGAWQGGRKEYYRFIGEALTSRGFVAVIPDYRVYPEVQFPGFVEDGAQAIAWVRRNIARHGGDPERILVMGHSAGAHIAALLMTEPAYLQAAGARREQVRGFVGLAGPYWFEALRFDLTRPIFENAPDLEATMPFSLIRGGEPPMLLLHGADDTVVLPINAEAFAERVTDKGGTARSIIYPDTGHLGILLALAEPFRRNGGILDDIDAFLKAHARPAEPSPPLSQPDFAALTAR